MLHRAGMQPSELQELLVAGGFGSFIHLENAIAIGLLPEVELPACWATVAEVLIR